MLSKKFFVVAFSFTIIASTSRSQRSTPGAASTSLSSQQKLNYSVGEYIELDASIKNEMYGTIDFPNADLKDIIKAMSKMGGKNFILDDKLGNKKISILSPEVVTKQEAYNAFLSALYASGYSIVGAGKYLKIVDVKSARQSNTRVFYGNDFPNNEEVITLLYQLKNLDAQEIQKFVQDLMPRGMRADFYPDTNFLVMTDSAYNLRRITDILTKIDIPGNQTQLESIPVEFASAKELATLLDEILDAQGGGTTRRRSSRFSKVKKTRGGGVITKIVPDERTNSLVVLANGRGIEELKQLIAKLDNEGAAGGGNVHVYYCKNAVAKELSETLGRLVSSSTASRGGAAGSGNSRAGLNRNSSLSRTLRRNRNTPATPSSGVQLSGDVRITHDDATNSLVISASGSDFQSLKKVLDRLDLPRRQVFVEATIMEVQEGDSFDFSVDMNVAGTEKISMGGFFTNADGAQGVGQVMAGNPTKINGLIGAIGLGAKVQVTNPLNDEKILIDTVTGLITAIETSSQANILQRPQILTSDNEEALLQVRERIAVQTGTTSISGTASGAISQQTVTRENIELELKITPRLGRNNDLVRLEVEQSVDTFGPSSQGVSNNIDVIKRKTKNHVVVRSGDTVVVGGLNKISHQDSRKKFPLLGDLPVLGHLFKGQSNKKTRSNLLLFLTPHIIEEYRDLVNITGQQIARRIKLGKSLFDPKDRLSDEIAELKAINESDKLKDSPRGWGFGKSESSQTQSAYIPSAADEQEVEWQDEVIEQPVYEEPILGDEVSYQEEVIEQPALEMPILEDEVSYQDPAPLPEDETFIESANDSFVDPLPIEGDISL